MNGGGISVVLPTRDHKDLLRGCLEALKAQTLPPDEIVVVDNGSADGTGEMLARGFAGRVRCVREERRGVHHARNRGAAEARGELLFFTDDDALPSPGWVRALAACFEDARVKCAGGPVEGIWPSGTPAPVRGSLRLRRCLGEIDWGGERRALDPEGEFLTGANLACRRSAFGSGFQAVFPYGPLGVCGDDYELSRRLSRGGGGLYEPAAPVRHRIAAEKLRWTGLLARTAVFAAAGARLGHRLRPRRGPRELLGAEGLVSAADALGHAAGRLWAAAAGGKACL